MSSPARDALGFDPNAFDSRGSGDGLPAHATYYEQPLLKRPKWGGEVVTYLFLGGVMGGTAILLALGDPVEDRELKRNARYTAFAIASICPPILVSHLGRPERFLNMMRVVKIKSPMSLGVWGLVAFSLPAGASAAAQLARDRVLPPRFRFVRFFAPPALVDPVQAALGAFIAGYTGVLLSATAIPVWAKGKRYIPAISVSSGLAGACALAAAQLCLEPRERRERSLRKVERLALCASGTELALLLAFEATSGDYGKPLFRGEIGRRVRNVTELGGILGPALLSLVPFGGRAKTLVSSALALAGGFALRRSLIDAGKRSADDPRAARRQPE